MLNIEYCNGGNERTGQLLQAVYQLIPEHWRMYLTEVRVVVSGEPLACVSELAADVKRFVLSYRKGFEDMIIQHAGDTEEDREYQELAREALELEDANDAPFDGAGDDGVWVPEGFDAPTIFVHHGTQTLEQIVRAFIRGCGILLAESPQLKRIIAAISISSELILARVSLSVAFDDFCLSLIPQRRMVFTSCKIARLFVACLQKVDAILNPSPVSGTSGTA